MLDLNQLTRRLHQIGLESRDTILHGFKSNRYLKTVIVQLIPNLNLRFTALSTRATNLNEVARHRFHTS